jgi:hypothetical protein
MLNEFAYAGDGDPQGALSSARDLVRRVRAAQRATWFPLLVFAAVILASIPIERYGGYHRVACKTYSFNPAVGGLGRACVAYSYALFAYWPAALILAYVAIAAFYAHQSRKRGVGTRVRPYVIAGIALAVALIVATLWVIHSAVLSLDAGLPAQQVVGLTGRLVRPTFAIGLALLVLAWAERSLALLVFTVGYLVILLAPITFGWVVIGRWFFSPPLVISASLLLLGAVGFAIAQRRAPLPAP